MNNREKLFAAEYIINHGNAYRAAMAAGYSEQTAHHANDWIRLNPKKPHKFKPELASYIREEIQRLHNEKTADEREVMEYLTSVLRGESSAEVIAVVGVGKGVDKVEHVTKRPDERERLKAAEQLAKMYEIGRRAETRDHAADWKEAIIRVARNRAERNLNND